MAAHGWVIRIAWWQDTQYEHHLVDHREDVPSLCGERRQVYLVGFETLALLVRESCCVQVWLQQRQAPLEHLPTGSRLEETARGGRGF